jgi:type I site-specific restriction endonuclease
MRGRVIFATVASSFLVALLAVVALVPGAPQPARLVPAALAPSIDPSPGPAASVGPASDSQIGVVESDVADLQRRVDQLTNSVIDQMRSLVVALIALLGAFGALQAFLQYRQDRAGVKQVSQVMEMIKQNVQGQQEAQSTAVRQVMEVIRQTLEGRLLAETAARKQAEDLRKQIKAIETKVNKADEEHANLAANVGLQRRAIENSAEALAQTARHGFRPLADRLREFARQFDGFKILYGHMDEGRNLPAVSV